MYVTYFDEVKANPRNNQLSYWVGGVTIPMELISDIEKYMSELAEKTFGTHELTPSTEFHASHIYWGKGAYKGMKVEKRIELLVALVETLEKFEEIKRVFAEIVPERINGAPRKISELAFAFYCERVQMLVRQLKSQTILIGDQDDEQVKSMIRDFARYRDQGTFWQYGIKISNIVDTVHFAQSHHSRLVQLADIYMFYVTHMYSGSRTGWMADTLRAQLRGKNLYPHRYKEWPPAPR